MKITTLCIVALLSISACAKADNSGKSTAASSDRFETASAPTAAAGNVAPEVSLPVQNGPKTVMDFFALLPERYFTLEGCERATDKDCKKARAEYLKTFTEVSDIKNGYFKGGCDGAQSCIEMAIFKRPNGTYLVGVATFAEMMNDFYFLDYGDAKWTDVSAEVVPDFSKKNWYELPRVGTTMKVYAKKVVEKTAEFEISEKSDQFYELTWKDGKFSKAK